MNAERWQKVKSILEQALELTPESRAAFLAKNCGGDRTLQIEVEELLKFEEPETDLLENDLAAVLEKIPTADRFLNQQIGNYKIIEELGVGGMGVVFLAERADGEFQQKVALKLIKRGMDSEAVLRRFITERQILASLEHPNIARLMDGGTTAGGLPYFVMEFVEGIPLTDFAELQNLDLDERLNLFREICTAVSFAHQNLVIHRDLKPSNIPVTKDGKVKLLDFGIAKVLDSKEKNQTVTQNFAFTPDYASPEQVRGEKLTTATDIYSLGVILYELLTGTRPSKTESKNIGEIIKAVCETEPKPPSSVVSGQWPVVRNTNQNEPQTAEDEQKTKSDFQMPNPKSLRGDLDNIILKSLRKEPERRYSSVEQFAEDLRRYQTGLPVIASADTFFYRATKFVRRNRLGVAAGMLILLSLIGGLGATLWQNRLARQERERAERRSENLRKISNSMIGEIERAIRDLPGSMPARKLLLDRAVEQLDALAAESEGDNKLKLELVWAYQNLANLPDRKLNDRRPILEKAAALSEQVIRAEPENPAARDRLAMVYLDMIFNSRLRGDVEFTVEYNRRVVNLVDEILRESPDKIEYQDSFWTANYHYVLTLQQLGRADETIETARKILPVAKEMYRSKSDGYDYMKPHLTRTAIGYGLNYRGDYPAAVKEFETALEECRNELAKRPEADILRRNEANILLQLASALENTGDPQTALKHTETALSIRTKLADANPSNMDYVLAAADGELSLGLAFWRQNQKLGTAERFYGALEIYEKIIDFDSDRVQTKILAARAGTMLGSALVFEGKHSEGLQKLREAVDFYRSIGAADSLDAHLKRYMAEAHSELADALLKLPNPSESQISEARENRRQSLEIFQDLQRQGTLRYADLPQLNKRQSI